MAGGYQAPANPAPVSGPGALSQRTDGGPSDGQKLWHWPDSAYGQQQQYVDQQRAQRLAESNPVPDSMSPAGGGGQGGGGVPVTPIHAPTQNPNEPVTSGVDVGPGAGSEVLPQPPHPAVQQWVSAKAAVQALAAQNPGNTGVETLLAALQKGF